MLKNGLIRVLAISIGACMAQGELIQYTFEGSLLKAPKSDNLPGVGGFAWTLWVDTNADRVYANDYSFRIQVAHSELIVGSLMVEGTADLIITNDIPVGDFSIDYIGARFTGNPVGFSRFDFETGLIGDNGDQLIDSLDLLTDPIVISGHGAAEEYNIRTQGQRYTGYTEANTLRVVPAPSGLGLLVMSGFVGVRRRR